MFESGVVATTGGQALEASDPASGVLETGAVLQTATLAGWVRLLAHSDRAVGDGERIAQIRALEELFGIPLRQL